MGLFGNSKVKVIKETRNDKDEYILDCNKLKTPMNLGRRVIQEFMRDQVAYIVLDTNFSFQKDNRILIKDIEHILKRFDEQGIIYECKDQMVDKAVSLMGIPMKKKKVREYKVVAEVTNEVLEQLDFIYDRQSVLCYIVSEQQEFEKIYELHNLIHVDGTDYSTLLDDKSLQSFVYFDNYFKRIRIATEKNTDILMINRIVEESYS